VGDERRDNRWQELDGLLRVLLILSIIVIGFLLLRFVLRSVTLTSLAAECGVSRNRIWELGLHFSEQLRSKKLSVCEVVCAKLFSEGTTALLMALVLGCIVSGAARARRIAKAIAAKPPDEST